jgi:hypothetical protein
MTSLAKMGIMINSYDSRCAARIHDYNDECYFAIWDHQLIDQEVVKMNVCFGAGNDGE